MEFNGEEVEQREGWCVVRGADHNRCCSDRYSKRKALSNEIV